MAEIRLVARLQPCPEGIQLCLHQARALCLCKAIQPWSRQERQLWLRQAMVASYAASVVTSDDALVAASKGALAAPNGEGRMVHLRVLEAKSIQIFREVAAEFQKPVSLYSIRKDSPVMLRLAQNALPRADSLSFVARR